MEGWGKEEINFGSKLVHVLKILPESAISNF
jgi:hypothetical protein